MDDANNHTLRLLRELRDQFASFQREVSDFRTHTDERFDELVKLFAGEGVLARYAVANVDTRLPSLEERVAALEETH